MKSIEKIMEEEGWEKMKSKNAGKIYIEFHKHGLVIDLEDIDDSRLGRR